MAKPAVKTAARKPAAKTTARKGAAKKASTGRVTAPAPATPEDAKRRGSVVGSAFKLRYAERGNPDHCGDWLAATLAEVLPKGYDDATLVKLAKANGLDGKYARWAHLNLGQRRMLLGLALRPVVATEGKLVVPGEAKARKPTAAFIAKHAH